LRKRKSREVDESAEVSADRVVRDEYTALSSHTGKGSVFREKRKAQKQQRIGTSL